LEIDDGFGALQPQAQTNVFLLRFCQLVGQRAGLGGFRPTPARGQCTQRTGVTLAAPFRQG
jgi:hypothetical protein